ncbi:DUF2946 domain-containing protein [Burkholderia sp. AU6039]|uniref:DUF2946 domain-containing protein n=1 Tax=Burkholderia sp. AU6039 TaxID=2015344 RepID=UPI000B79DB93|nr:DUF2946 domain-containing protein [Burkholderia sp. AU6039]OXJ15077.1 hypothetical protein CFB39_28695 [Burkholderia sp. AU6039]
MLSRRLRKIGSLIGMLAILMTALAPTISQALTTQQRVETLLAGYCSTAPATGERAADSSQKSLTAHLQACGYCSLLAHTPALPAPELTLRPTCTSFSIAKRPASTACAARCHTQPRNRAPLRSRPDSSSKPVMPSSIAWPAHAAGVCDLSRFEGRSCVTVLRAASCRACGWRLPVRTVAPTFARGRTSGRARSR